LRDLTEVHRNAGKHGEKARRKIAGAKWNNFGILRCLRRYVSPQSRAVRIAPIKICGMRRADESRPLPGPFLSWDDIGADRIGSE
jgi:hypothetical protein